MLGSKTCLGIDVGGRDIKVVELRKVGRKYEVVQAVRISVPHTDASEGLSAGLRQYLLESKTSASDAVCSLSANACSIKFAQVPKAKSTDLTRMVRFEAESQIPLPLTDLVWDFSADGAKSEPMRHVVIAAARKAEVDKLLASMNAAQVRPQMLTPSVAAGAKAVSSTAGSGEPILVIDIGAYWTDLTVIDGGRLFSSRSVRFGSEDLTEAFARDFSVDAEEAERLKRTHGITMSARMEAPTAGDEVSAVELWAERMSEEIRRSVVSVTGNGSSHRPQRAVLIGGSTGLPSIVDGLSRRAGVAIEVGEPWSGMQIGSVCSHTLREPPASFAVATGLAMSGLEKGRTINLMPQHIAEERLRRKKEFALIAGLGLTAVVLVVVLLTTGSGIRAKSAQLNDLKSQVKAAKVELQDAGAGVGASAAVIRDTVNDIERPDLSSLDLLRQFSTNLPRSMWLSEFSYESGKSVVLKGVALSNSTVADAVDLLTQLDVFDNVTLDYSNLARNEGYEGYDFQITCNMPAPKGKTSRRKAGLVTRSGAGTETTGIVVQ